MSKKDERIAELERDLRVAKADAETWRDLYWAWANKPYATPIAIPSPIQLPYIRCAAY